MLREGGRTIDAAATTINAGQSGVSGFAKGADADQDVVVTIDLDDEEDDEEGFPFLTDAKHLGNFLIAYIIFL